MDQALDYQQAASYTSDNNNNNSERSVRIEQSKSLNLNSNNNNNNNSNNNNNKNGVCSLPRQIRLLLWKRYRENLRSKLDIAKLIFPGIILTSIHNINNCYVNSDFVFCSDYFGL